MLCLIVIKFKSYFESVCMKKPFLSKKIKSGFLALVFLAIVSPLIAMQRHITSLNTSMPTKKIIMTSNISILSFLNTNKNSTNVVSKNSLNLDANSGFSKIVVNDNNNVNNTSDFIFNDDQMDTSEDDCIINSPDSVFSTPTKKTVSRQLFVSPKNQVIPINKSYKGILKDLTDGKFDDLVKKINLFLSRIPYDSMTKDRKIFLGAIFFSIFSLLGENSKPLVLKGDDDNDPCMIIQGYTIKNVQKFFFVFSYGDRENVLKKIKKNIKNNAVSKENKMLYICFRPDSHFDKFLSTLFDKSNIDDCFFSNETLPGVAPYDHQDPYHAFLTEIEKKDASFSSIACEKILKNIYSNLIDNGFSMEYENFFQLVLVTMLSFVYNDIQWEEKCLDGRSDGILFPTDIRNETIILEFKFRGWKIKDEATNILEQALNQIENKYAQSCLAYGKPIYMIAIIVIWNEDTKNLNVQVSEKREYKYRETIKREDEFLF